MNTAERIKAVRGRLTQAEFADRLGLHKNTLGRYERGESEPDISVFVNICSIFGVSPQWLLLGRGPMRLGESAEQPTPTIRPDIQPSPEPVPHAACPRCLKLETELDLERRERRELAIENRQLLRENGELRVRVAQLEAEVHKLPEPGGRYDQSGQTA